MFRNLWDPSSGSIFHILPLASTIDRNVNLKGVSSLFIPARKLLFHIYTLLMIPNVRKKLPSIKHYNGQRVVHNAGDYIEGQ